MKDGLVDAVGDHLDPLCGDPGGALKGPSHLGTAHEEPREGAQGELLTEAGACHRGETTGRCLRHLREVPGQGDAAAVPLPHRCEAPQVIGKGPNRLHDDPAFARGESRFPGIFDQGDLLPEGIES